MEERKEKRDPLGNLLSADAEGEVIIEQLQKNVKVLTISIKYTDKDGVPQTFNKQAYIHAESGWAH
jgi:hypothetical protein